MSAFFRKGYVDHGTRVLTQTAVAIIGNEPSARLTTGESTTFDLLVAGIGVEPVTDLAVRRRFQDRRRRCRPTISSKEITPTSWLPETSQIVRYNLREQTAARRHWDIAVSQSQQVARALPGRREAFVRELAPELIHSKRNIIPERLREAGSLHELATG